MKTAFNETRSGSVPNAEQVRSRSQSHITSPADHRASASLRRKLADEVNNTVAAEQLPQAHTSGCCCGSCSTPVSGTAPVQAKAEGGVIQRKLCKQCGWEGGHAPTCTSASRAAASEERKEANKKATDQSMDGRTRADQSHRPHGSKHLKNSVYKSWRG